jgi:WD40 repeat protein
MWDPARPAEPAVFKGHDRVITALVALHDGRLVFAAHDDTVRVWDPGGRARPLIFQEGGAVDALAVLPGDRILISVRGEVRLRDLAPGSEPGVFAHQANALAVMPDGRIASGVYDGSVQVWELPGGPAPAAAAP